MHVTTSGEQHLLDPPFLIIGPPRVGSTLLCKVLNAHPLIHCSDEARPFLAAAKALAPTGARDSAQDGYRPLMVEALRTAIVDWYLQQGVDDSMRWGDKFPHYADPNWCPNMLESVEEMFPGTKYIFATRNKAAAIRSTEKMGPATIKSHSQVFDEITARGAQWERVVGPERFLRVVYEAPLPARIKAVLNFLGLQRRPELDATVARELARPTRYSSPTSW